MNLFSIIVAGTSFTAGGVVGGLLLWGRTRRLMGVLRQRTEKAENLLRARSELAQEVAHEIKNPLTAILCSAEALELLLKNRISDDEVRCLRYVREYGDNVLRLVTNYLDLTTGDAELLVPRPECVDLGEVARAVTTLLQTTAQRKNIELAVSGLSTRVWVTADPRHLRQIVFNLVHNALKFTPNDGRVFVRLTAHADQPIVGLSVEDSGVGIPENDLTTIFVAGGKKHRVKREGEGTGIGLPLTKRLIEGCGGKLAVASVPGRGTCFTVEMTRAGQPTAVAPGQITDRPLAGTSVLVVDADGGTRESIASLIESLGGAVDQAAEAIEAVDALTKRAYTAVMIDEHLPSMSGTDLAAIIRKDHPESACRIVVAGSGKGESAAADRFVSKPLCREALVGSLREG